jgi:hypothetical protein
MLSDDTAFVEQLSGDDPVLADGRTPTATATPEPDLVVVEEMADTITVPARDFWAYELDAAVEFVEWEVSIVELGQLITVYVMDTQSYAAYADGNGFSHEGIGANTVYETGRSGWVDPPSQRYVLVFEAEGADAAVEVSFRYVGKRRADS